MSYEVLLDSYWAGAGKHKKKADKLDTLIPSLGESIYTAVEPYRCFRRLYYDRFNNGSCNYDVLRDLRVKLLHFISKSHPLRDVAKEFVNKRGTAKDVERLADCVVSECYAKAEEHGLFFKRNKP